MSRRFLFALSLFLALLLVPSSAFALDFQVKGVLYSTDLDGSRVGFVVSAYNQFDAACYALGKDPNTISSAVKQKLSDSNYGGRFYDYAESFFTQSGGLENVPTWVPAYVILISELGDLVLSDYQGVWYSTVTSSLYDGAMVDFVAILNGEDLGGGGSGGTSIVVGDYIQVDLRSWQNTRSSDFYGTITATNATIDSNGVLTVGTGTRTVSSFPRSPNYVANARIYLSHSVVERANSLISQGYKVVFSHTGYIFYASDLTVVYGPDPDISRQSLYYLSSPSGSLRAYRTEYSNFYYDGMLFCFANSVTGDSVNYGSHASIQYFCDPISTPFSIPPSGIWPEPDTPVTPVEPDLPEPSSPVLEPEPDVPTVTPTWPDITINVEPAPTDTTPQDYTPWLSSILTSINSMRGELLLEFDGLVDVVRNVFNAVLNLGNVMEEHCVHIRNKLEECVVSLENYMRSLVHWLADQLRYDSDVTGDSDIFGVLSSIDSKLGGGTYEPNPLASELAYYGWNDDLWNRFLLGDNWETSVSGMTQDMGRLTTRFPFSIPWDVVALFRLFVHDPVTPVFDLPLYFSSDGYSTVHVDLSAWDSVAALVRPLVFVIFALKLALLSRDLLSGFFGGD